MNVVMPQLGETVAEGTVSVWHKQVGDTVDKNDILLDVETDKAAVEVPAPEAGVISEIRVEAGETVDVGAVLAVIAVAGEAEADTGEATVVQADIPRPSGPTLVPPPASRPASAAPPAAGRSERLKLSPVVRRLIAEHELDPHAIQGTGRDGRITRRDVLAVVESSEGPTVTVAAPSFESAAKALSEPAPRPAVAPAPSLAEDVAAERIEFDRIRRLTAEHMVRSKATSPHVLQAIEVDFSAVDVARGAAKARWRRERGFSLTYLPFISRAICLAIKEFPRINASVDGNSLVVHKDVNLSIAVALDLEGLVAPVIFNAGDLTVSGLAQRIFDISRKAREHKLGPDDLSGGTYTISNNGSFGTLMTAPIINQPQVAILSVDGIKKRPVVIESPGGDAIGIRPIGILAQSFDHRAIDGAYSGAFLARVRELLQTKDWAAEI